MSDVFPWTSPTQTSPLRGRFPALGFVPCPGDPHAAKHVAVVVQRTAHALHEISDVLHGTGEGDWKGKHADAFRQQFHENFRPKVDKANRSFGKAATALRDWADAMPEWQRKAEVLEQRAQDAQDALHGAKRKLAALPPKPLIDLPAKDDAEANKREKTEKDRSSAELAAATAQSDLDLYRAQARKLASDYDLEGQSVARRLDKAMDIAPNEPGLMHELGDAFKGLGKVLDALDNVVAEEISEAVADAVKWLTEHANAIAALGDVLGTISAALGAASLLVALVSPVSGPFAPVFLEAAEAIGVASGGFSLGALALHGAARAVGGDSVVSNRTLAEDALGVLPFGGGFKGISKVAADSRLAVHASNFGLVDTVAAFLGDPTALGYWEPNNERQVAEVAATPFIPGAPLLVAFENAWEAGAEKDKAARQGK